MGKKPYYSLTDAEILKQRRKFEIAKDSTDAEHIKNSIKSVSLCGADFFILRHLETGRFHPMRTTCDKKYCPTCMEDWSRKLKARVKARADWIKTGELRHLVLTIPNAPAGALDQRLDQLYDAFRQWRKEGRKKKKGAWWKSVIGTAWKLEIDYSKKAGWHPHFHILIHAPHGIDLRHGSPGREGWNRITENKGSKACYRNGIYIKKMKTDNYTREIIKYSMKPLQVKNLSSVELLELVQATYKRRFFGSSGTLEIPPEREFEHEGEYEMITSFQKLFTEMMTIGTETTKEMTKQFESALVYISQHKKSEFRFSQKMINYIEKVGSFKDS